MWLLRIRHFTLKQVFTTISLWGHDWADDCIHVEFGLVRFTDKSFQQKKEGCSIP